MDRRVFEVFDISRDVRMIEEKWRSGGGEKCLRENFESLTNERNERTNDGVGWQKQQSLTQTQIGEKWKENQKMMREKMK